MLNQVLTCDSEQSQEEGLSHGVFFRMCGNDEEDVNYLFIHCEVVSSWPYLECAGLVQVRFRRVLCPGLSLFLVFAAMILFAMV